MWIIELLGIVLLLGGIVFCAAFYVAFITGLIWMFFTGLEIVTAPVLSCPPDCFTSVLDSKNLGWMLIATPVLVILFYVINVILSTSCFDRKVK